MKLKYIVFISMYMGASQKAFQLPSLFQQREIKGLHAGHQILAMGMLKKFMKYPDFRKTAQDHVQSQVDQVVDHILSRAKPCRLLEDGQVPDDRIVAMNGVGDCSLHFYRGNFNIKRKGLIRRIRKCDIESPLNQLDDKTIHNYLSVAKIAMSRCHDDTIILKSHINGMGGNWQIKVLEGIAWALPHINRLCTQFAIAQGIRSWGIVAEREIPRVTQTVTNRVADTLQTYARIPHALPGEQLIHVAMNSGSDSYYYAQAVVRDGITYVIDTLPRSAQTVSNMVSDGIRSLQDNQLLNATTVGVATGAVYNRISQNGSAAAGGLGSYVADQVISAYPQESQEVVTTWALTLANGMATLSWIWPF